LKRGNLFLKGKKEFKKRRNSIRSGMIEFLKTSRIRRWQPAVMRGRSGRRRNKARRRVKELGGDGKENYERVDGCLESAGGLLSG